MNPRLHHAPKIRAGQAHRLAHRLFIGGLKNLLAGVTTVAHHNPVYREIGRFCPVRTLREFGWAHSFLLEHRPVGARGEPGGQVVARHHATPTDQPFIVHLSEGVDHSARAELALFDAGGCLTPNAAIVHGVALTPSQWNLVASRGAGLVWCPASNLYLFGRTPNVRTLLDDPRMRPRIALGSDSRISGARDLLDELKVASQASPMTHQELLHLVTTGPAELLRLKSAGQIAAGRPADLTILPNHADGPGAALLNASRKDVQLVMIAGRPLVGSPALAQVFKARQVRTRPVVVDREHKIMDASIARLLARSPIGEAGVTTERAAAPRAYVFVTSR
jgi:hypothetical protein